MLRSLSLKLILAFLVVGLIGAALVAYFARRATITEFDRFRLEQDQANFIADVSAYYQNVGSWTGIREGFRPPPAPPQPGQPNPATPSPSAQPLPAQPAFGNPNLLLPPPPGQPAPPPFVLVDQGGLVIIPAGTYRVGDLVPEVELEQGNPIEVNGQVVGTVLNIAGRPELNPQEARYLIRINRALAFAALGATGMALLLGIILARTLIRPLGELTTATRSMAKGNLTQQVPVRTRDELGELAASFNQMSADLAHANQLRRQMTADIAHDLRNPLMVLAGYIESLRDGVLQPNPTMFETMYDEAQHLQRLVEDLRTLSLADANELPLNCQLVSPQSLLERVMAAYDHQAGQLNISLVVKAAPDLLHIKADSERMTQVLGNLVSNALRYTPEGGQIVLSAQPQADTVLLTVQDNGDGIAPADLSRIFNRFYRADESRRQNNGESGLGLAIAKAIVNAHGGTISVESELGRGTTFMIALPVAL